mmetsp:Transcript_1655/g.4959  ORF Transcript_1655/g.4959 Transcript_1655/m.4959 type:complete len:232 (-) Transcript_1655:79-774(-)
MFVVFALNVLLGAQVVPFDEIPASNFRGEAVDHRGDCERLRQEVCRLIACPILVKHAFRVHILSVRMLRAQVSLLVPKICGLAVFKPFYLCRAGNGVQWKFRKVFRVIFDNVRNAQVLQIHAKTTCSPQHRVVEGVPPPLGLRVRQDALEGGLAPDRRPEPLNLVQISCLHDRARADREVRDPLLRRFLRRARRAARRLGRQGQLVQRLAVRAVGKGARASQEQRGEQRRG